MDFLAQVFKEQLAAISDKKEKIKAVQDILWSANEPIPNILVLTEGQQFIDEAFELSCSIDDTVGIANGYINKGFVGLYATQDANTYDYFQKGLLIFEEINDLRAYSRALSVMSYSLWMMGRYDEALEYAYKCLKVTEERNQTEAQGWSNYALGTFHFDLKDYSTSEFYYKRAHNVFLSIDQNAIPLARCKIGLSSVMIAIHRYDEALEHLLTSLEDYKKLNHVMGQSRVLNDIGVIYRIQGKYDDAKGYLQEGLLLREKHNYYQGIITSNFELGQLYFKTGEYPTALKYLFIALDVAIKNNTKPKLFQIHELIGEVYKQTNELGKALEHKELFFKIKSEVIGEQANNKLKHLQTQNAVEKSEKEAEIHRLKNVELKQAYSEIEEKNKSILDSINYAKRIQKAILPSDADIKKLLPESFVLYLPKDVVSGDFYWVENKGETKLFAAVDCTGHGVPGAFMSMIGNTLLNEIVNDKDFINPGEILSNLREGVIKALKQTGEEGENQDGMDISLCTLKNNVLEYAGANNPLWLIRNGVFEEVLADKQPIGIYYGASKPFTNHQLEVSSGDCIYIFTDGYADQMGGPKGKKFKYKALEELILKIHALPMEEQKQILEATINEWKANLEQVDDILLLGIRV